MPPLRRVSEIIKGAELKKDLCILLVEGPSDKTIIDAAAGQVGARILIYTSNVIDFDSIDVSGPGGAKGRLTRTGVALCAMSARRIICVVDKDGEVSSPFDTFPNLVATDLSCVEIYCLENDNISEYISRISNAPFTPEMLESVLDVSRMISVCRWERERIIPDLAMADATKSLNVQSARMVVDVDDWILRSSGRGGNRKEWLTLSVETKRSHLFNEPDVRAAINVHELDRVFRFFLDKVFKLKLHENWTEQTLRGIMDPNRLIQYAFFQYLFQRVQQETS